MIGAVTCCIGLISANQAAEQNFPAEVIPLAEQNFISARLKWPYIPIAVTARNEVSNSDTTTTRYWTEDPNLRADPSQLNKYKKPLIIVLHGNGTNANMAILSNGFSHMQFDVRGMNAGANIKPDPKNPCQVEVTLKTLVTKPQPEQKCKEFRIKEPATVEDDGNHLVKYIDSLQNNAYVDPKRIYVFGESGGGFVLLRNLCKLAGKVAAVGISAALPRYRDVNDWVGGAGSKSCSPNVSIPYIHIHGTADQRVNIDGVNANDSANNEWGNYIHVSVDDTIKNMVSRNSANFSTETHSFPRGSSTNQTRVTSTTYYAQDGLAMVRLLKVEGGGHLMPGLLSDVPNAQYASISLLNKFDSLLPTPLGPVNLDIVGADEVAKFFMLHKLN